MSGARESGVSVAGGGNEPSSVAIVPVVVPLVLLLLVVVVMVVVVAENGREKREEQGVEGGGSRLETQVDISLEQTRHLPTIRKTFTSSVPGGALLRYSANLSVELAHS